MEITGKVIQILPEQRFNGRNGEVVKNTFVIETQGQYPKKIAFSVLGEERFKTMALAVGNTYNVSFDIESREWSGKWFTDVSAWRALCVDGQQQAQPAQSPVQNAQPAPEREERPKDDLPF
jgi:hypothetical protein